MEDDIVTIEVRRDGPYRVLGPVRLIEGDGAIIPLPADGKVFLCRCGRSAAKPFCDGAHKRSGSCDRLAENDLTRG